MMIKRDNFRQKHMRLMKWHTWFAWFPVRVDEQTIVWLGYVERRLWPAPGALTVADVLLGGPFWEYRRRA